MRVVVDRDLCQGHGVCTGEAPEVFRVVERAGDYAQVELLIESPPEALRAQVEAAVRYCPNRALRIVEDERAQPLGPRHRADSSRTARPKPRRVAPQGRIDQQREPCERREADERAREVALQRQETPERRERGRGEQRP